MYILNDFLKRIRDMRVQKKKKKTLRVNTPYTQNLLKFASLFNKVHNILANATMQLFQKP